MTTDLRELLKEARDELNATLDIQVSPELKRLVERIDAALSEPVPEPVAWMMYDESKRIPLVCHLEPSNRHLVDAFPVYRAPLPASTERRVGHSRLTAENLQERIAGVRASPSDTRDAARYRWLCEPANEMHKAWLVIQEVGTGKVEIDAAINAAIEREGGGA